MDVDGVEMGVCAVNSTALVLVTGGELDVHVAAVQKLVNIH